MIDPYIRLSLVTVVICLLLLLHETVANGDDNTTISPLIMERRKNHVLYKIYMAYKFPTTSDRDSMPMDDILLWKDSNKLLVTVLATGEGAEQLLQQTFDAFLFEKTGCSTFRCSGYLPMDAFLEFEAQNEVKAVCPSLAFTNQAGSVVTQAFESLRVDLVRMDNPSLDGSGLSIGVMSNSFNNLGGYAADVDSNDLPSDVTVVLDQFGDPNRFNDEGRAMAQLIHDLAPGAKIFFRTALRGSEDFAIGIQQLADLGCDVIVDDLSECNWSTSVCCDITSFYLTTFLLQVFTAAIHGSRME